MSKGSVAVSGGVAAGVWAACEKKRKNARKRLRRDTAACARVSPPTPPSENHGQTPRQLTSAGGDGRAEGQGGSRHDGGDAFLCVREREDIKRGVMRERAVWRDRARAENNLRPPFLMSEKKTHNSLTPALHTHASPRHPRPSLTL